MQLVALLTGLRLLACLGLLPAAAAAAVSIPSALQETVMGQLAVLQVWGRRHNSARGLT